MLAKAQNTGAVKKKEVIPKYSLKMDLVPYLPKFRQPKLQSYFGTWSAYQHLVHFNTMAGSITSVAESDALKIRLFISTLKGSAFDWYF